MIIYLLRRLLLAVITLFILTLFSFSVVYFKDVSALSHQPIFDAYLHYLLMIFNGDLGTSLTSQQPIAYQLARTFATTLELCILATAVALLLGIPLGIIAGVYDKKVTDKLINVFVLLGLSTPTFWLALLLVTFFSFYLDWLPVSGRYDLSYPIHTVTGFMYIDLFLSDSPHRNEILMNMIKHSLLPVFTLAIGPMTETIKLLRKNVIAISKENYIKAAATRGLSRAKIIERHVLHNALPPIIPILGLQFSTLLTLTMIVEIIFDWNGLGHWLLYSLHHQDYAVISSSVLVTGTLVTIVYILSDIIGLVTNPLKKKELYAIQ
jgi:cationic peptide transport system permease protein